MLTSRKTIFSTLFAIVFVALTTLLATPVFATNVDATKEVKPVEVQHKWFFWPGWAFVGLTVIVVLLVFFSWYKSVIGPKYRGKKVSE
jgi:hypothetical protein